MSNELAAHPRLAIEDRIKAGEDRLHAELAARREFGSMAAVREATRDAWGMDVIRASAAGHALRNPASPSRLVSVTVVTSLTIGISPNSAVFTLIDSLLGRRTWRIDWSWHTLIT